MENNTTRKRKANSQCPPTLTAEGGGCGGRGAEKFVMLAIMKGRFTKQWPSG